MTTEGERCVDELIRLVNRVDDLSSRLESTKTDELLNESKKALEEAQLYIENHKPLIPSFTLKSVTDSLNRLRKQVEAAKWAGVSFKFSRPSSDKHEPKSETKSNQKSEPIIEPTDVAKNTVDFFGFRDLSNEDLTLKPDQVESKDVQLINLSDCSVTILGFANTMYIRNLKNTKVVVCLASRAITITDCHDCKFKFICQQLRIDSTFSCSFCIFTSARSMLESSKDLIFKELNLEQLASDVGLNYEQHCEYLVRAKFDRMRNNWKCIDDFDWLSPIAPSMNYKISE